MSTQFYTIEEVCERLRIGKTMFHSLVKSGRLAIVKIGRKTLVSGAELERFAEELTRER